MSDELIAKDTLKENDQVVIVEESPSKLTEGEYISGQENMQGEVVKQNDKVMSSPEEHIQYKLYKRRFVGMIAIMALNVVAGMNWPWFGPISNASECLSVFSCMSATYTTMI